MSTNLVNLSVLVGVRIVSYKELQDVEIQADLGSRDSAVLTFGDVSAAAANYNPGQPLEIKAHNQARLFRGRIVGQNISSKYGTPRMIITGMSEMRPSPARPLESFALHRFQNLDHRIETLLFRKMPTGYPWRQVSKIPVDVWKASFALQWPSEGDFATYTLGKHLEFTAQGRFFQGTIESLEISIHRDARPTKFMLHLIGTLDQ
jgi:hypothetical protein